MFITLGPFCRPFGFLEAQETRRGGGGRLKLQRRSVQGKDVSSLNISSIPVPRPAVGDKLSRIKQSLPWPTRRFPLPPTFWYSVSLDDMQVGVEARSLPSFRYRYLGIVGLAGRAFRVRCAASLVCCPSQKTWLWLVPAVDERRGLHRCDRPSPLAHAWVAPWARKMLSGDSIILLLDASHSWDGHGGGCGCAVCFPACLLHACLTVRGQVSQGSCRECCMTKWGTDAGCSRNALSSTRQHLKAWTTSSPHCNHRFLVYWV